MGTPPPPLSPTVATPLAHRKRRHSEINAIERPKNVSKPQQKSRDDPKIPVKSRLEVPKPRGRSATPVKRDRSATPSSGQKPVHKANGAVPPRPGASMSTKPGSSSEVHPAGKPSVTPRPGMSSRPSASPRPSVASRPSASPRPSMSGRPGASPRPSVASRPDASPRPKQARQRRIEDSDDEDSDDSGIDKSDIEDIVDSAELEPFPAAMEGDDAESLDAETAATLKTRLLKIGPQAFMEETLDKAKMPPQILGTAFGLDPKIYTEVGEEIFMRILGQIVVRTYFKRQKLPMFNTLDDVADLLKKCNNIVVIAGAGISTSLGIPDFRSKNTGFYARAMEKAQSIYYITEPEEIFDIHIFDENPNLFYKLAGDILPNEKKFSPTHAFIKLLQDKGKLLTCYTQNIDNLEEHAGISRDKLIQCHGSFATATCRRNGVKNENHRMPGSEIEASIRAGEPYKCKQCIKDIEAEQAEKKAQEQRKKRFKLTPNKRVSTPFTDDEDADDSVAPGVMKPDITFFGEALPNTFFTRFTDHDCKAVDLVLVLGTSLKVAPVSEMPNYLPHEVPHVYVSREAIRHVEFDVQCLGDCDDVVVELVRRAGWSGEEGRGVVGHEMVERADGEGRTIAVEAEGEEDEGEGKKAWKWRVRREEAF